MKVMDARLRDGFIGGGVCVVGLVANMPLLTVLGAVLVGLVLMALWLGVA
jgi:hypothetical protein